MRVLVVDDDDDVLVLLTLGLERMGFLARGVTSIDDALRSLADSSFDAVVTDWHLAEGTAEPIMDNAFPRRIVLLTGDERMVSRAWPPHVLAHRKPSSLKRIAEALRAP